MDPNLVDKIIAGDSAAEISDYIKDALFGKASEKIDALRPEVASSIFNSSFDEKEVEPNVEPEQLEDQE